MPVAEARWRRRSQGILGGSWDLVSKVISTLSGVISVATSIITPDTKSHDPPSMGVSENRGP